MRVCMCELFNLYVESRLVIAFEEKKLDTVLKSRDSTLPAKVYLVKAMVFPVVMYGMDVRVGPLKKAEHRRIDAFKLWCWRRLLSPLESKKIKSVNPKGNQP